MSTDLSLPQDKAQPLPARSRLFGLSDNLAEWPWWLFIAILAGLYIVFLIITDEQTRNTFWFISGQTPEALSAGRILFKGITVTLTVAVGAYLMAITIGLTFGLMRSSSNPFFYNLASLYVELTRGEARPRRATLAIERTIWAASTK